MGVIDRSILPHVHQISLSDGGLPKLAVPFARVTVEGLAGDRVQAEVMSYTEPCRLNAMWFKDGNYGRIAQEKHPGWSRLYARVLVEGPVRTGDRVMVEMLNAERFSQYSGIQI
ncbi:MAG: hypothetical protein OJF47_001845 [Nitrospira sp.]|jgi:MOSC domain-containing protein YiiM|nr:MAG: hypothetical protein OJF47_001845 [Nitrospira sp.]